MTQYAGLGTRVNECWHDLKPFKRTKWNMSLISSMSESLHNNTTTRYDEATATLSLTRTFDFFNKKLKNKHLSLLRKYCKKKKMEIYLYLMI
jgi:hypothetical protein